MPGADNLYSVAIGQEQPVTNGGFRIGYAMIESRPEIDQRLVELKHGGAFPVAAIKAIRSEFEISLGEAKIRFAQSADWADQVAAGDQLHQQFIDAADGGESS